MLNKEYILNRSDMVFLVNVIIIVSVDVFVIVIIRASSNTHNST